MPRRKFVDFHTSPTSENLTELLLFEKYLGFSVVGISFQKLYYDIEKISKSKVKKLFSEYFRKMFPEPFIKISIELAHKETKKLIDELFGEIPAIYFYSPSNEKDLESAIRKGYPTVITLELPFFVEVFSEKHVNLLKQARYLFIEIKFKELLNLKPAERAKIFGLMRRKKKYLEKINDKIIFSSGAEDIAQTISPRSFRCLLALLGVSESTILKGLSENPHNLLKCPEEAVIMEIEK
ncbi:MAG: RNase P subunit p30 family protein [Candidatus Njordarchaeales archaeon]